MIEILRPMLDRMFATSARALSYASLFEDEVVKVTGILELKKNPDIQGNEAQIIDLFRQIHSKSLSTNIKNLKINSKPLEKVLQDARLARNNLAHDVPRRMMDAALREQEETWPSHMHNYLWYTVVNLAQGTYILYKLEYALTGAGYRPPNDYAIIVAKWACLWPPEKE